MQFDGNDLEKDDIGFPVEDDDSGAISWEELLSDDKDIDLDDLIKDDTKQDKQPKEHVSEIDINEYANKDTAEEKSVQLRQTENETFDLNTAANEYVNSLQQKDADINSLSSEPANEINASSDNEILNSLREDGLLEETENIQIKGDDLADVVDDELLSLLDIGVEDRSSYMKDSAENNSEADPGKKDGFDTGKSGNVVSENSYAKQNAQSVQTKNKPDIPPYTSQTKSNETAYSDEDIDTEPAAVKTKKTPLILTALVSAVIIFAAIAAVLYILFPGLTGTASSDLMTSDISDYQLRQNEEQNVPDIQKQTKDLAEVTENKTENAKKQDNGKKIVVTVQTGGRTNPFVPSTLFGKDGSLNIGADLTIPPDINVNSPEAVAARKLLSIIVSGIMYDSSNPSAILKFGSSDYFVQKGDSIDTYTVDKITKEYVQIKNGTNVYKAYVGEAFATNEHIPESKQMKYESGARQYISANDVQINRK